MTRRLNIFLLVLLVLIGAPFWWLLLDTSQIGVEEKRIDIGELRALADAQLGQKPTRVNMELAAWRLVPGDIMAAGSGLKRRLVGAIAFRLEVPGKGPVMIDSGTTRAIAGEMGFDLFDREAQGRIDADLRSASLILLTHEHPDHAGGLAAAARARDGSAIMQRVVLNREQVPGSAASADSHWPRGAVPGMVLNGSGAQAVAPGVVVLPGPGHTPGSQMIYVRLASGAEYLFAGDTASMAVNWIEQRPRSRLLSNWLAPEDRKATVGWLRAIAEVKRTAPNLHIVPGHDFEWLHDRDNNSGVIGRSSQGAENVSGN
jgi:glyoxylase-like metal-dependent hydrolase (beta-lactamase superfamily II)